MTARTLFRRNYLVPLSLVLGASALRVYGAGWGLPEVYEEATPLTMAWSMWGWGTGEGIDLNPHFFNYPGLTIYIQFVVQGLLYLVMRAVRAVGSAADFHALYITDKTAFLYAGRLVSCFFGAATVLVTWLTARLARGRQTAAVAGLLIAINVFHIERSQMIEVDVPMTFFIMLAFWAMLKTIDSPTLRNRVLTGASIGLAVSSKYTALFLVLPLAAAWMMMLRSSGPSRRKSVSGIFTVAASAAAVFAVTSPYVILDFQTFLNHLSIERSHMALGHFGIEGSGAILFYLRALAVRLLGFPMTAAAAAGMIYFAFIKRRRWAVLMALFTLPYLLTVGSWAMKADRYILPLVPILVVFASAMTEEVCSSARISSLRHAYRTAAAVGAVMIMAAPMLFQYPGILRRMNPDSRTIAKGWITRHIPSGSFIALETHGPLLHKPLTISMLNEEVRSIVLRRIQDEPHYAVLTIPMHQTSPELTGVFYDISLYRDVDVIMTSSAVRDRYMKDPEKFGRQIDFYEYLDSRYRRIAVIEPDRGEGPVISIYANPASSGPFGGRSRVHGPAPLKNPGMSRAVSEDFFYLDLGSSYESFRYYREALASYRLALERPVSRPASYNSLVLGITRCLLRLDRRAEAVDFLERAAAGAPTGSARERFIRLRRSIISGNRGK